MATQTTGTYFTLIETARRHDPDGNIAKIAEVLTQKNQLLEDAVFVEANNLTSHMYTQRLTEPSGSWVNINEHVSIEASRTKQLVEPIRMLESYSRIDERILEIESNPGAFRSTEDMSFVAGLAKTFAESFFYGASSDDPSEIIGISNRSEWDAAADTNVLDAGGSSKTSSVWIIDWGVDTVHLVYPKGSKTAGIAMEDLGRNLVNETAGSLFTAYVTRFKMHTGVVPRDPRCIQRICSIDPAQDDTYDLDTDDLVGAIVKMPEQKGIIYMNKTILSQLLIDAKDKTNVQYPPDDPWGRRFRVDFMGLPVKIVEQLTSTETAL